MGLCSIKNLMFLAENLSSYKFIILEADRRYEYISLRGRISLSNRWQKPNVGHLRVLGSLAYAFMPPQQRHKLQEKATKSILLVIAI